MSDHSHPDESSIDRAYLSVGLLGVALAVAMGIGQAAPAPRKAKSPGKEGVLVLDAPAGTPAEVLYGTIVERGAAWKVIGPGGVRVVPKDRVRPGAVETETDVLAEEYFEQYPTQRYPLKGLRGGEGHTRAPAPRPKSHRLVAEAELAQARGAWAQATAAWAEAYGALGFRQSHLANLRHCAYEWFHRSAVDPRALARHLDGLEEALRPLLERPEIRGVLAFSLADAAKTASAANQAETAIGYAERLRGLGAPYDADGQAMLDRLRSGPRFAAPREPEVVIEKSEVVIEEPDVVIEDEDEDEDGGHQGHDHD